jgi:hypothetical protein
MITVMDRDRRLTGYLRGQTDQAIAPAGFELSNGWRVSYSTRRSYCLVLKRGTDKNLTGREAHHVKKNIPTYTQRQTIVGCVQAFYL